MDSLNSHSSADSIRGPVKSWRCNNDGQGFGRLPWLQCATLARFVVDLSELDRGGGTEGYKRYGGDEGEGREDMK